MSLSYVIGNSLVDADEFIGRVRDPDAEVKAFGNALKANARSQKIESSETLHFRTGLVTLNEFQSTSFRDVAAPFEPVGIGTGNYFTSPCLYRPIREKGHASHFGGARSVHYIQHGTARHQPDAETHSKKSPYPRTRSDGEWNRTRLLHTSVDGSGSNND